MENDIMTGDAKEHVFVWLQRKVLRLKVKVTRLRFSLSEEAQSRIELELAMPVNQDGDTSIPCPECGAKMTFTHEALKCLTQRAYSPTRW